MGDQRRSSWPWKKLKGSSSSTTKAGGMPSHLSSSQLLSPTPSLQTNESAHFLEDLSQETVTCEFVEDARVVKANALREQAEESLRALKQELSIVMREVMVKEALVQQHQQVADEAMSGWEKAEKDALPFKEELEHAAQQRVILEDRVAQLDGALKECMRQVRHVRDEQEGKIQEAITCKTEEWEKVKAELEAEQADLQRRLLESDAQNSAMIKSLQERARKILEANEAKSTAETESKVLQVRLGLLEKDIFALQYELQLLSKQLDIRNEEVAFCKKSADIAHKQHLDNVQKVAKLEADCQRLRNLVKKKLPGPAAIAQMRKEVEGLPQKENYSETAEFKRRPNKSNYASSTIAFTNSHQRGVAISAVNRDVNILRERLFFMEEENKLLREALSKRIGELQTSWLLCAKTANKLSMAEDQLESLQATPRGARMNGSDVNFPTTTAPSVASISDENGFASNECQEEASCAESWASALIGELAHFRNEKIISNETIKEVTESYKTKESVSGLETGSALHAEAVVLDNEECPVNSESPEIEVRPALKIGNCLAHQSGLLQALSLVCKDLDHAIEEQLRTGQDEFQNEELSTSGNLVKESVKSLVDAAHQKFSELEKAIERMGSISMQSVPHHAAGKAAAIMPSSELGPDVEMPELEGSNNTSTQEMDPEPFQPISDLIARVAESRTSICEVGDECRNGMTILTPTTTIATILAAAIADDEEQLGLAAPGLMATSLCVEAGSKLSSDVIAGKEENSDSGTEDKHELASSSINFEARVGEVLCQLIGMLEMLHQGGACATVDAEGRGQWEEEKRGLVACKESIVDGGQQSVLEFLVRVGMVMSRACQAAAAGAGKREEVLESIRGADVGAPMEVHVDKAVGELTPRQEEESKTEVEVETDVAEELRRRLAEVEREKEGVGEEREKLREEAAQLQEEVARQKKLNREVEARCEELLRQIPGFQSEDDRSDSAVKVSHVQLTKLQKERELMEAKEKLAECKRTIEVLGMQLHSLSPHKQLHLSVPRHHYPIDPHYADMEGHVNAVVDQPPRPRGRKQHVVSRHPLEADPNPRFSRQSGPVHVAHTKQTKARRQCYVEGASGQQPEDSPPMSARSSPASAPAQRLQRGSTGRQRTSVVRTSLTQSLNATLYLPAPKMKPHTPPITGLGKLFSISKHGC